MLTIILIAIVAVSAYKLYQKLDHIQKEVEKIKADLEK